MWAEISHLQFTNSTIQDTSLHKENKKPQPKKKPQTPVPDAWLAFKCRQVQHVFRKPETMPSCTKNDCISWWVNCSWAMQCLKGKYAKNPQGAEVEYILYKSNPSKCKEAKCSLRAQGEYSSGQKCPVNALKWVNECNSNYQLKVAITDINHF